MVFDHYDRRQGTLVIYPTTVVENIAPDTARAERALGGELLYGKLHTRDNRADLFQGWLSKKGISEHVETTPTEIFMVPSGAEPVFYNLGGLIAADAQGRYDFRDYGLLAHEAHLLKEHVKDLMVSEVGTELAIQHGDKLSKSPDIAYIVIEKGRKGIYGVKRICKHSAILYAAFDSYKRMDDWARREGVDTVDWIRRGHLEEVGHMILGHTASVENERSVRLMMIDIYSALAEKTSDLKVKGKYQNIISALERELACVKETYSKLYSNKGGKGLVENYMTDSDGLVMILEAEAMLEHGLIDEGEVRKYVESRLDEIAEAVEEDAEDYDVDAVDLDAELADAEYAEEAGYDGRDAPDRDSVEGVEVCATEDGDCTEDGGGEVCDGDGE